MQRVICDNINALKKAYHSGTILEKKNAAFFVLNYSLFTFITRERTLRDCTGFEDEVVCGSNGVTYHNSCEFAKGICQTHGHALHAVHHGPC
ncbi:hypothetical protein KUTeg_015075 [Tegillarca granosa]|uniref:Kazal-like domain-containing protein n=1 Tax=Tegillarca granosa TaxID=220873 RepID=A0ABQ9ERJ4_TEGGR|nr:hypothetical protein KUTeg_015075 [Tegillarca granosa]